MTAIRFDDQVAIVTGAGGGIGEAIALELGRRGAAVVVNDYGGDIHGRAGSIERAAAAAERIIAAGGRAVPEGSMIGTSGAADTIIATALRSFGRIDMLVNVAGTLGNGDLSERDDEYFLNVLNTHLIGARALMYAVWPRMRLQGYGRIVNTLSSCAFGRAGMSSYAAGKGGLLSLTRSVGLEGTTHNILVNGILPTADSRMTRMGLEAAGEHEINAWFQSNFQPWKVGQAVAYLLSRQATISGEIFAVGGGRLARIAFAVAKGYFNPEITAENVAENFDRVMDLEGSTLTFDDHTEQDTFIQFIPRPQSVRPK
jgi:NAD(P)-dependent dehydrogenase (short-subunit alcohol dehydrogenase family)